MIVLFLIFENYDFRCGCTNLHSHQKSSFSSCPNNISYLFDKRRFNRCEVINSLLYTCWFAFPWWIVWLSTFLYTSWLFLCLQKNVYSGPLPRFKIGLSSFCYSVVWVLYIFWKLARYQINGLQLYCPILYVVFHFFDCFFYCAKALYLM